MTGWRSALLWVLLLLASAPAAADTTGADPAAALFQPARFGFMRMNPEASLVAVTVRGDDAGDTQKLWIIEVVSGRTIEVIETSSEHGPLIGSFEWGGNRTLIVTLDPSWTEPQTHIVRLERGEDGQVAGFSRFQIGRPGVLVDPLPADENRILYAKYARGRLTNVYRLTVSDPERMDRQFRSRFRIVKNLKPMIAWLADADGQIRLAVGPGKTDDQWVLRIRETPRAPWRAVWRGGFDDALEPVAFGERPGTIIALTSEGRDKRAVVEFDTVTGTVDRVIYEDPVVDVTGVIQNPDGRGILGVRYFRGGKLDAHYLDAPDGYHQQALEKTFPGNSVQVVDLSADRARALVLVSGPTEPGRFYLFDSAKWQAQLITSVSPWLEGRRFRETHVLAMETDDGFHVEGYLTLPDLSGKAPLVVMPHGGPIGVRDVRLFNPVVQYLAGRGFAVLQVNYRGSAGFGKAFQQAGQGQWGQAIEDDIETMMDLAFDQYPIDPARTCIFGSSYGGYSALMSVIRSPQRFRCAASYAGVTDLILLFDRLLPDASRATLVELIGDPGHDRQRLIATSPVYQYRRIRRPLFLAHGTDDTRVDVEHCHRLNAMLTMIGRAPETLLIDGAGHEFGSVENQVLFFHRLDRFLSRHLSPVRPVTTARTD